jgi:hypothetical protein
MCFNSTFSLKTEDRLFNVTFFFFLVNHINEKIKLRRRERADTHDHHTNRDLRTSTVHKVNFIIEELMEAEGRCQ